MELLTPSLTNVVFGIYPLPEEVFLQTKDEEYLNEFLERLVSAKDAITEIPEGLEVFAIAHDDAWFDPGEIHLSHIRSIYPVFTEENNPQFAIDTGTFVYYFTPKEVQNLPKAG